ncbi:hypothetical protein RJ639_030396 [Escallonia herrerae]|uniref:Methyltransferase n=1 Tax=Escallonia herrerae TaxID=1293975 RepID=A0AA89BBV5_9ASTE|nr:hypothetical protein RJ639_030396 [Escallonia herrerae]
MKHKDGKPLFQPDKSSRIVPMTIMFIVLCGFSFYLGGIFCSEKDIYETKSKDVTRAGESPKETIAGPLQVKQTAFPECGIDFQDYTPCTDPKRWRKYSLHRLTFMERHCPSVYERKECLVPPPDGYKVPIKWPKSKNECWYRNVPYDWINKQKSNQHWLTKEGEKFLFPGGGTMFPNGVGAYVDLMQDLIPGMKDGTVRTAIDTGCGMHTFVWTSGIISEACGIYLLEIHRILRPGGFWVLSGPPVNYENRWRGWNTTIEDQKSDYEKLQELLTSMCFKLYNKKDDIAVWQKSSDSSCYKQLDTPDTYPPKCDDGTEPDSAWYTPLRPCVVVPNQKHKKSGLKSLSKWPERLHVAPERVGDVRGGSAGAFNHDDSKWKVRVKHYKKLLPAIGTDKIRNVMDMNTLYGGFAAAVIGDPLWVMNVVSSYAVNTLPVVYDRGLIGTYHDWCEAFSTYPRTYDLLHLDGLFTAESHRCDMKYVLLEMDRILRPNGYAIIRESSYFVDAVASIAKGMRWGCRKEDTEYGVEKEKVLICQKKLWYSSKESSR